MNPASICPVPAGNRDEAFLRALDVHHVAQLAQTYLAVDATLLGLRPQYVRWKDRDGSLIGYAADVRVAGESLQTYLTVRTAPAARLATEAERIEQRAEKVHHGLRGCALLRRQRMLLVAYPIDRGMRELRHLVRASKVRGLLLDHCPDWVGDGLRVKKSHSAGQLVSYKPERRAVVRWHVGRMDAHDRIVDRPSVWLRCHAEPTAERTRAATDAARTAGVRCPRTIAVAHSRLALEDHVDGVAWRVGARASELDGVATTLARLHRAAVPDALPLHTAVRELDTALRCADDLGRLDGGLGERAARLCDRLARYVPEHGSVVLSHGDLHPEQVLVGDGSAALVDFDRACAAPPAHDLASMCAHLMLLDERGGRAWVRALLDGYARGAALPSEGELIWWLSAAMLRLATGPFRRLDRAWPERCSDILTAAERALATGRGADRR